MGDKSTQKKQYIIEKAKEVFANRGFKVVTMKDIVDACGISRGGLYLYFGNTKDLFEAVLEQQTQNTKSCYEASLPEDATPGDQLLLYLDICKKDMLAKDILIAGTYEYLSANAQDCVVSRQKEENARLLEQIITNGVKEEWMVCENPATAAAAVSYAMEGLKAAAGTTGISEKAADDTINYIMGTLGLEVE